jgi:ABC-type multidrug transport system ATPase subunit
LRSRLWKTFKELARDGTTLFISTHLMDEAMLCDRIAILRGGKIIAADTPRSILEEGRTRLRVEQNGTEEEETIGGHPEDLAVALRPYGLRPGVTAVDVETDTLEAVVLSLIEKEEVR